MARPSGTFRQLAHHLHLDKPLKQGGVQDLAFARLQREQILALRLEHVCLDSTTVKVHPDGAPERKKNGLQAVGHSRGGCTKIHLAAANARYALILKLPPGQTGDAPHGRELLEADGPVPAGCPLIMDSAYEGDEILRLARQLSYLPVVPPNPQRRIPWEHDHTLYHRPSKISSGFSSGSRATCASSAVSTSSCDLCRMHRPALIMEALSI